MRTVLRVLADAGTATALCGLLACSEPAAPGSDLDQVRSELAGIGTALTAEPVAGLAALAGRMESALSAAGPAQAGALYPPAADGARYAYDAGSMEYHPVPGGSAGEVSLELYRIVPATVLPELPLTVAGVVQLIEGSAGTIRVTSPLPGFVLSWIRPTGGPGLDLTGEFRLGSRQLSFAALLPPARPDTAMGSIEIVDPATGFRYVYRQVVPLGQETALVDIEVDYGARLRLVGSYTVRGPDLAVTIEGISVARVTLSSRLELIVTPTAGRRLSASEESVIRQAEALTGPVSSFLSVLAFPSIN